MNQAITEISGDVFIEDNPVRFVVHGELGVFSSSTAPVFDNEIKDKDEEFECIGYSPNRDVFFERNSFPKPEISPKFALYTFSMAVSDIPEVTAVTYQIEQETIRVWTFIPKRDKAIRRSIYEEEFALMDNYPNMIFDFNVVSLEDFASSFIYQDSHGYLVFYRELGGD